MAIQSIRPPPPIDFLFQIHKQTQMLSKNVSVLITKLIDSVPKLTMSSACLFGRRKKYDVRYALRFVFVMFNIRHFRFLFWSVSLTPDDDDDAVSSCKTETSSVFSFERARRGGTFEGRICLSVRGHTHKRPATGWE